MEPAQTTRVDKWLWFVRLFKTRAIAMAACDAGHVQVNGQTAKPSRAVRTGDTVRANTGVLTRTVKVLASLEHRVGAKLVADYLEDLTPASEYEKARVAASSPAGYRPAGSGRPTKRDRRILSSFFGDDV